MEENKNKYQSEIEILNKAIELLPNNAELYFVRGNAKLFMNDDSGAIDDYNKLINLSPNIRLQDYQINSADTIIEMREKAKKKFFVCLLEAAVGKYLNKEYNEAAHIFRIYFQTVDHPITIDEKSAFCFTSNVFKNLNIDIDVKNRFKTIDDFREYLNKTNGKENEDIESENTELMVYGSEHIIGFGKYKGEKLIDIINKDCEYIFWCIKNLTHFTISCIALIYIYHSLKRYNAEAVKINMLKYNLIDKWYYEEMEALERERDERSNNGYSGRDYFDAMTDGQFGNYDDFDGNSDDISTWSGRG